MFGAESPRHLLRVPMWFVEAEDDDGELYLLAYISKADDAWSGDPSTLVLHTTGDWAHPDAVYRWDSERRDFESMASELRPTCYELAIDYFEPAAPYGWPALGHVKYFNY